MRNNSLLYWYNTLLCNLYWLLGNFRFFLPSPSNYSEFHTCTLYVTYWFNSYNVMIQRDFYHKMCCYNHYCTLLSPAIVVINTIISLCIIGSQMYVLNKQMQLVHFVMAISCNFLLSIHIQPMLTKTKYIFIICFRIFRKSQEYQYRSVWKRNSSINVNDIWFENLPMNTYVLSSLIPLYYKM